MPFNEKDTISKLHLYLPSQAPIHTFIHHNTLNAFQDLKFFNGIFKASKIFGFQVTLQLHEYRELYKIGRIKNNILEKIILERKGKSDAANWKQKLINENYNVINTPKIGSLRANWKSNFNIDLDTEVQPILFRILNSYLDQGIALSKFPINKAGFLESLRDLEKNEIASFFKTQNAKWLLLNTHCEITDLLKIVVGSSDYFEQYLFDQQFSHPGWSGIVSSIEEHPNSLLDQRRINLTELIALELLLEIDALDNKLGKNWSPLGDFVREPAIDLFSEVPHTEFEEILIIWQLAFEWNYYDEVLAAININKKKLKKNIVTETKKSFQALFCIDERECSLRRNLENTDKNCETFGTPGFFNVEFFYQPLNGHFYDKLCPAPVTPKYLIKESQTSEKRKSELLYTKYSHTLIGGTAITLALGVYAGLRMVQNLFKPAMSPAISNALSHTFKSSQLEIQNSKLTQTDLQAGFSIEEMTNRVEGQLRSIGLIKDFASLIYIVAHGSSSANNAHHGAHECGACNGRPGSINSRVFSFMANHLQVREVLAERGISIPKQTIFVAAIHDTCADQVQFYDDHITNTEHISEHKKNIHSFETALDINSKERSRRFASINTKTNSKETRKEIAKRSVSLFEPRPELGHATNALCIIGNRKLTKNLFLDRRAFLNSYDYKTDPEGNLLLGIMKPIGPVCGGINLEYYFSRLDKQKLGCGTKLPHNVMGLIGVANSCDGDLRPGLPIQMTEIHDPVRLLTIIEHHPDVVLKIIKSDPAIYNWFVNEWIHLAVSDPESDKLFYFKNGDFIEYEPSTTEIKTLGNIETLAEQAIEIESNEIAEATLENLPIYLIN